MIKSKVRPGYNNPFTLAHISIGYIENEIKACKLAIEYAGDIKRELGALSEGCIYAYESSKEALSLLEEALEYKQGLAIKDTSKLDFYQEAK